VSDSSSEKTKVLFLCTGNSCRSQMGEGWARALRSDDWDVWSAGVVTHGLNPLAVKVMGEAGVDISGHASECVDDLLDVGFDVVLTVCDNARQSCPVFPGGAQIIHHAFDDPPHLAREAASEEEALVHYCRVRDEIREYVTRLELS
jgi:arsenate reductase (thioredoxin)